MSFVLELPSALFFWSTWWNLLQLRGKIGLLNGRQLKYISAVQKAKCFCCSKSKMCLIPCSYALLYLRTLKEEQSKLVPFWTFPFRDNNTAAATRKPSASTPTPLLCHILTFQKCYIKLLVNSERHRTAFWTIDSKDLKGKVLPNTQKSAF